MHFVIRRGKSWIDEIEANSVAAALTSGELARAAAQHGAGLELIDLVSDDVVAVTAVHAKRAHWVLTAREQAIFAALEEDTASVSAVRLLVEIGKEAHARRARAA